MRKNHRITTFVPLTPVAEHHLGEYLASRDIFSEAPIFVSKFKNRLSARDTRRICARLSCEARKYLTNQKFHISPHQLRHSFLKRVTDEYGIHFTHRVSGNISVREIFRYAKPSQEEINSSIKKLF